MQGAAVGNFGNDAERLRYPSHRVSGVAAHYHTSDYVLAGKVLREGHGFNTQFYHLEGLTEHALGPDWQESATWLDRRLLAKKRPSNGIMVVTR